MWDQLSIYIFTQHGFIPRSILKLSHSALLIRHVRVLICNRQVLWPVFHLWIFKAGVAHELQLFIFTWPSISVHCLQRDDRLMEMRLDSFYVLLSLKLMSDFLDVNPNVIHLCDTHANHSFYQVVFDWFCYWVTSELRLGFIWVWDFFSFFLFISFTDRKLPVMFERVSPFFVVVCPHFITDLSFRWSLMTIGASQLFRITSMTSSQKNKRS